MVNAVILGIGIGCAFVFVLILILLSKARFDDAPEPIPSDSAPDSEETLVPPPEEPLP